MGDGSINHNDGHTPRMKVEMVNREYLEWLSSTLSPLCGDVTEWEDTYCLYTTRSDCLESLQNWYNSGEKIFGDITLTPTVLKHWYVCDGNLEEQSNGSRIRLAIWNERSRTDDIISLFTEQNLPEPTIVTGNSYCNAQFTQEETKELFRYIGEPVHGFESKWPNETFNTDTTQ